MNELDLFAAAIAIADPQERASLLDRECVGRPDMRQRIDQLLGAHFRSHPLLDPPCPEQTGVYGPSEQPGAVIAGRYKLLEQIGEGGMGTVWVAEQTQPVRRKVALKLIKTGMDSKSVIARFEAERQALAVMDHPNVAKVLDGGLTEAGRPFFVMEYVKGVPITEYCDATRLSVPERLQLFTQVCQAVQHAHQKGIIHRDLKPSNILVAPYDDKPVPKIIDFGLAKAMHQSLTEKTLHTAHESVLGTPLYMSPEQAQLNNLDVDSRSDIYSLGVLLYELLTGTTPLERQRFKAAAWDEIKRIIREEEPPRPSTRLSSTNTLPSLAASRQTEPLKLTRQVQGELDWIVMKALEKDRTRRYETASGLARDVERYLADEVVEARPPTAGYRLSKFARKYKKGLATAAAFASLLIAGLVLTTSLAVWATSAERDANRQRIASDEARQEALNAKAEADKQRDEVRVTAYASGIGLAQRAWEENNVGRARELLDEVPREAAGRDLRGFEWYYLSRLCHAETLTLAGHASQIQSVAFSPDGQRLASASWDTTVKIWDSATGKELLSLKHSGGVTSVAFSPDGRRLASADLHKTVRIWDSATGKELLSLEGHTGWVNSVAFSPDGQRLSSGSMDNTVKIWDSATGKELLSLAHNGPVLSVAYSPDGRRLASARSDQPVVRISDSATGKELLSIASWGPVAFSPDGQRLASGGDDNTGKIWDSATGKELLSIASWGPVAFSPDGQRLASASRDGRTVLIWDSATGKELLALKGHTSGVKSVAFSPDGQRLASGGDDNAVKIWDSMSGKEPFALKGHTKWVNSVVFSPDGERLASGSMDSTVKIWDSMTGKELFALKGHAGLVCSVAFSPDGQRLASGGDDNTVRTWDSATGKELLLLNYHSRFSSAYTSIQSVAFSPDGQRLASGGWDGTVKIWDSVTGKELLSLKGHTAWVSSVAFSPDGQRLASASGSQLKIWDSATGKELIALNGHAGDVMSVAFSPDGQRLASANEDGSIHLWETRVSPETTKGRIAK